MDIYNILLISMSISMILYYMYETDVIWEYLNKISFLFQKNKTLQKFFNGKLLLSAYPNSGNNNYIAFINTVYNTFFTRLISCPICFGFWIAFIFACIFNISYIGVFGFLSLSLYYIIKFLTKISL